MTGAQSPFPQYSRAERAVDAVVHAVGVPAGVIAAVWLLAGAAGSANALLIVSLAVYGAGLIGMLAASAAYHLTRPGRAKDVLRRTDHAMIFVMIAGSYTPFALNVLEPPGGIALCAVVWALAVAGIAMTLALPRRLEFLSLALYLGMGWLILVMIGPLVERLPGLSLGLLLGGGVVYSAGVLIYMRRTLKYHTALWHAFVLVAAGLHVTALYTAFMSV